MIVRNCDKRRFRINMPDAKQLLVKRSYLIKKNDKIRHNEGNMIEFAPVTQRNQILNNKKRQTNGLKKRM